jgi:hypothetical protein
MRFDYIMRRAEQAAMADKSALGAINRPLRVAGGVCKMPTMGPIGTHSFSYSWRFSPGRAARN